MRTWIVVLALVAVAACKKEAAKPDLSKLPPEEACRVIGKRAFECKETIVPKIRDLMSRGGADEKVITKVTDKLGSPMMCEGVTRQALDQMITCYDPDCGKLAACYGSLIEQDMRPAGGDAPHAAPEPGAAVGTASSGSATTP